MVEYEYTCRCTKCPPSVLCRPPLSTPSFWLGSPFLWKYLTQAYPKKSSPPQKETSSVVEKCPLLYSQEASSNHLPFAHSSWWQKKLSTPPESSLSSRQPRKLCLPCSFRAPSRFSSHSLFIPFSFPSIKLLLVPQKPIWILNNQSGSDTWLPKSATPGQKLIAKNDLDISQFGGLQPYI